MKQPTNLLVLNAGLATHNGDWNWRNVSSPFTRLYCVTAGEASVDYGDGRTLMMRPGHLYLLPAFTRHNCVCKGHFVHYYLHIYESCRTEHSLFDEWVMPDEIECGILEEKMLERLCTLYPSIRLPQSDPKSYDNAPTLMHNIRQQQQAELYEQMEMQGITCQLMSRFLKEAKPRCLTVDSRVRQVLDEMRRNLYTPVDVGALAQAACLSRDHLIRLFKRELQVTPLQYINRKKVEEAQLLLLTGEQPVKSIAYRLGFDDHSYFNRLFRKITGSTPKHYREQNRSIETAASH